MTLTYIFLIYSKYQLFDITPVTRSKSVHLVVLKMTEIADTVPCTGERNKTNTYCTVQTRSRPCNLGTLRFTFFATLHIAHPRTPLHLYKFAFLFPRVKLTEFSLLLKHYTVVSYRCWSFYCCGFVFVCNVSCFASMFSFNILFPSVWHNSL